MKHIRRMLLFLLVLGFCFAVGCTDNTKPTPKPDDNPPDDAKTTLTVIDNCESDYTIIYPADSNDDRQMATTLSNAISGWTGLRLKPVSDETAEGTHEILVGKTNRAASAKLAAACDNDKGDHNWGVATDGENLAVYATDTTAMEKCIEYMKNTYVKSKSLTVSATLWDLGSYTKDEEDADLAKAEEERRAGIIADLKAKIAKMSFDDFGGSKITTNLGGSWAAPTDTPIESHPRLLITKEDLPALKEAFFSKTDNPTLTYEFQQMIAEECTGILGAKQTVSGGVSNYNNRILIVLQAKALAYLLTDNEVYAYEAVYGLCNYLRTLDIGYYSNDQCRRYGHVLYSAALIYDWCYDILNYDMKMKIISGVEHNVCAGKSSIPDKATWGGLKMEMGFPPTKAGDYVIGHSSEGQFLRDYVSFAIAVYDDVPGWWKMIGGRLYEEYVPIRQQIYADGMFPEGTGTYAPYRFMADLRCEWMLRKAMKNGSPYTGDGMKEIVRSFISHETAEGKMFTTGDGNNVTLSLITIVNDALMSSYLFGDTTALSMAKEFGGDTYSPVIYEHSCLSPIELLICIAGSDTTKVTVDWRKDLPTIRYNGGFYQQIIARDGWNGTSSAVVRLAGPGRATNGHTHASVGTFEIYYKGLLTGDAGVYDSWGSNHQKFYHRASIAHNCMLVYNPSHKNDTYYNGWYTGGQKDFLDVSPDKTWLTTDTKSLRGKVTGVQYTWRDEAKTKTDYVYYANDLSLAYPTDTVSYYGRSFLASYTENSDFPMILFVFDRIDAVGANFQKTFLLQCSNQPTISGNTVTVNNGKSKLVLTSLKGGDTITSYGGDKKYYIPTAGKTLSLSATTWLTDPMWGRVEISPKTGNKSDLMLNVLYVTDSATTKKITPTLLASGDFIGANALNQTAYFCTLKSYASSAVTLKAAGTGDVTYYVGGLAAGTWTVTAGNKTQTVTVTEEGHMATFTYNGTGDITLTLKK